GRRLRRAPSRETRRDPDLRTPLVRSDRAARLAVLANGAIERRDHHPRGLNRLCADANESARAELFELCSAECPSSAVRAMRCCAGYDRSAVRGNRRRLRGGAEEQAIRVQHSRPVSRYGAWWVDRRPRIAG